MEWENDGTASDKCYPLSNVVRLPVSNTTLFFLGVQDRRGGRGVCGETGGEHTVSRHGEEKTAFVCCGLGKVGTSGKRENGETV